MLTINITKESFIMIKTVVQKYGGTSVNTPERRNHIVLNAQDAINDGLRPVVVVSAMGRYPEPYATDSLLSLLPFGDTDPRNKDLLVSCGEILTTVIVAEELSNAGMRALALTGGQAGIITDDNFGEGNIDHINTEYILSLVEQGIIPVVAGFQGVSKTNQITTLGRGGSDITATALGAALNSTCIEIYTDVDGVMTADPNVVDSAELLDEINYNDVFQLASLGAKVIHPRAVQFAKDAAVDVSVINVNKGRKGRSTLITGNTLMSVEDKMFNAVTSLSGCSQVEVPFTSLQADSEMFAALTDNDISIDMINIFPDRKNFIISDKDAKIFANVMDQLELEYKLQSGYTKITILGNKICGVPGVMAKIITVLYANNIMVYQSSDSNRTIAVLVKTEVATDAVKVLHKELIN